MKIFLPSHHAHNSIPCTLRLVPSDRALQGGQGDKGTLLLEEYSDSDGQISLLHLVGCMHLEVHRCTKLYPSDERPVGI